jgi:uncharacterized protein DUF4129
VRTSSKDCQQHKSKNGYHKHEYTLTNLVLVQRAWYDLEEDRQRIVRYNLKNRVQICDWEERLLAPEMNPTPEQPENKREEPQGVSMAVHWLKDWIFVSQETTVSSIGEILLPFLLAAMESCWIAAIFIGLASANLFETSEPLMPLWAPFMLIIGSLLLVYYLGLRTQKKASTHAGEDLRIAAPDTTLFITLIGVLSLFLVWLQVYAQTAFIFDPKWLLSLFNDILLLNGHFYEVVSIIGLSFLLGWRGIRLINHQVEPSNVFRALCLGLGVIIMVIILRTGQASAGVVLHDDAMLLLLIPLFLFLSLAAHALAQVVFIRHSHPTGLQGSIVVQERAIIMVIGSLGLALLLIALLIGGTTNPAFLASVERALAPLGVVYNWFVGIVAAILVVLATPIFWLVSLLHPVTQAPKPPNLHRVQVKGKPAITQLETAFTHTVVPILSIVLPILFILLIVLLIRWTLRQRRVRQRVKGQNQDVHESLWSWSLFWTQLRAILRSLFARFIRRDTTTEGSELVQEEIKGEPAVRSIREIYRALLKKAARRGYPRKRFETPYEFKQRLDEKVPLAEPQLEVITEAYALTRYGGDIPDEAQLELVRSKWVELDQKWV